MSQVYLAYSKVIITAYHPILAGSIPVEQQISFFYATSDPTQALCKYPFDTMVEQYLLWH
jgi:hypothetical protein